MKQRIGNHLSRGRLAAGTCGGVGLMLIVLASPLTKGIGIDSNRALQVNAPVALAPQEAQSIDPEATPGRKAPTLDAVTHANGVSALRRSTPFREAMGGRSFSITQAGPLTVPSADGGDAILGAVFEVRLSTPTDIVDQPLPSAQPDPRGLDTPPYQAYTARFTASKVSGYTVLVDTARDTVIAMIPLPGADVARVMLPAGFAPKYGVRTEGGVDITTEATAAFRALQVGDDPAQAVSRAAAKIRGVQP